MHGAPNTAPNTERVENVSVTRRTMALMLGMSVLLIPVLTASSQESTIDPNTQLILDSLNHRFNSMNDKIDSLEKHIDQRFDSVDERPGSIEPRLNDVESVTDRIQGRQDAEAWLIMFLLAVTGLAITALGIIVNRNKKAALRQKTDEQETTPPGGIANNNFVFEDGTDIFEERDVL